MAMLRWIAYIKSLNPEIHHIARKNNAMADMLSRARFEDESDMVSEDEEVTLNFFKMKIVNTNPPRLQAGHKGIWAKFKQLKEKYRWSSMYKDVLHFVSTCESGQAHSNICHCDELQPVYPLTIHFNG